MTVQDVLPWFELPECGPERAQRFYEALVDIASGDELRRPFAVSAGDCVEHRAARASTHAPCGEAGA